MRARLFAHLRVALFTIAGGLALLEVALRAFGFTYSPLALLPPDNQNDLRAFHGASLDPRISASQPVTVFDPVLLWVPNPSIGAGLSADGTRGGPLDEARAGAAKLIVAVGDSNTMGTLNSPDHWPGYLQDLLDLNAPPGRLRVVNAGVYGYSSFQGLRRARQVLGVRPDVVYFSFGSNDAHPVRRTDEAYARRVAWLSRVQWLRLAPPLMHALWAAGDRLSRAAGTPTHRVPLAEYRQNLEEFVRLCRAQGALPVLLTRPYHGQSTEPTRWMTYAPLYNQATREVAAEQRVALVDVYELFRNADDLFSDESHFTRRGYQRLARQLLSHLRSVGVVQTAFAYRSAVDLGFAPDFLPELVDGWHAQESWPTAPRGRWIAREATVLLERHAAERGLDVDLTLFNRANRTTGRIEANGRTLLRIDHANGRLHRRLDVSAVPERQVAVRFVVDTPAPPTAREHRELGLFAHAVALQPTCLASRVETVDLENGQPELGAGFWPPERWPDGRSGRWTKGQASLRLGRMDGEDRLAVDFTLESPRKTTAGSFEVNGRALGAFRAGNGRRTEVLDVSGIRGDELTLVIRVVPPVVPRLLDPRSHDGRVLGMFVHEARLERSATPAPKP